VKKETDDLSPATVENYTLHELKKSWMAKNEVPTLFISAKQKTNFEEFKKTLYQEVKNIHTKRYPYNHFLY
jgi:GTP-binding protein HflX